MRGWHHFDGCTCKYCRGGGGAFGGGSGSGLQRTPALELLEKSGLQKSWAARYLTPNAKCPRCGDPVFYYQNEFGSRVFFDDVGGDWPKHECTDRRLWAAPLLDTSPGPIQRRSVGIAEKIEKAIDDLKYHRGFFKRAQLDATGDLFEVIRIRRNGFCNLIGAVAVLAGTDRSLFVAFDSSKFTPPQGAFFNYDGEICRFYDLNKLASKKFKARRLSKEQFRASAPKPSA